MKTTTFRALSVLACAGLVLAGCAKESSGGGGAEDSPLQEFYGALFGEGQDWDEEEAERQHRQIEESVAACMAAEGFDYQPVPYQDGSVTYFSDEEDGLEYGTVAYAEKYGYGVTYWQEESFEEQPADDAVEYVDPNEEYVQAMSPGEQEAYYEVLWGGLEYSEDDYDEDGMWIGEGEDPSMDWRQQGCYGAASHEVYEEDSGLSELTGDPAWIEIEEQLTALYEQLESDPTIVAARTKWSSCMADAGYTYSSQDEAMNALYEELSALWDEQFGGLDEEIDWDDPEAVAAYEAATSGQPAGWDDLREREYATAIADAKCAEQTKLLQITSDTWVALEQQFVDDHGTELDAIVDKYGAAEKK